ncbi:FAD binding domain-containing protein [Bradyrhizobium sp. AUGA SZCCT0240]|uniref:FAD binding domain-containing protein n=1 Tax=Bradyrhizobium sp. AUGA SZCCT0240 TaxID=2807669 RepID=UPI001BAAE655|nr:FAD binding domain-containing protein [Bradyrhizobium sp. AUGA SZCCT0240]MBR1256351.1 FAD binding domain-containing protein [Bradyrhizobium sp. AUGA SZCCT0240]
MKAAQFEYARPETVAETCELLAQDENARILAGGQTLIPMLAMRLARPSKLVDVYRIQSLKGVKRENDAIVIGAGTRQVEVERSALARHDLPLLARALPWVGHPPTRNRGTVGGSIANADPSAEIPLVAVTLGAEIEIANTDGGTSMPADEFFIGAMVTSVMPGDCLTAVRFPVWSDERVGSAFHEISARKSDFAFVATAAQVAVDEEGNCLKIALGVGGLGDRPICLDVSPAVGAKIDDALIDDLVRGACRELETYGDLHASAEYRSRVAVALSTRALRDAVADARRPRPANQEQPR